MRATFSRCASAATRARRWPRTETSTEEESAMNDLVDRPAGQRTFTAEEIAAALRVSACTVRVAARSLKLAPERVTGAGGHGRRYLYTYTMYRLISEKIGSRSGRRRRTAAETPDGGRTFTASEIAELIPVTPQCVLAAARTLRLEHGTAREGRRRCFTYSYGAYVRLREYFAMSRPGRKRRVTVAEDSPERSGGTEADGHPLVTDPRCLDPNWWPDTVPECFKCDDGE